VNRQSLYAQPDDEHGHSIGRVSTTGDLLVVELDVGLISAAEVPDFFILKNLVRIDQHANGNPICKAIRIKVTVQDVIAAAGLRSPDVNHSQRKFNTGIRERDIARPMTVYPR
jgi:hypothetical protein